MSIHLINNTANQSISITPSTFVLFNVGGQQFNFETVILILLCFDGYALLIFFRILARYICFGFSFVLPSARYSLRLRSQSNIVLFFYHFKREKHVVS